jgi:hypothetical protein
MLEKSQTGSPEDSRTDARQYLATRFTTLLPTFDKGRNPIKALRLLHGRQWLFFLVGLDTPSYPLLHCSTAPPPLSLSIALTRWFV